MIPEIGMQRSLGLRAPLPAPRAPRPVIVLRTLSPERGGSSRRVVKGP